jgi:hypothetical protein
MFLTLTHRGAESIEIAKGIPALIDKDMLQLLRRRKRNQATWARASILRGIPFAYALRISVSLRMVKSPTMVVQIDAKRRPDRRGRRKQIRRVFGHSEFVSYRTLGYKRACSVSRPTLCRSVQYRSGDPNALRIPLALARTPSDLSRDLSDLMRLPECTKTCRLRLPRRRSDAHTRRRPASR